MLQNRLLVCTTKTMPTLRVCEELVYTAQINTNLSNGMIMIKSKCDTTSFGSFQISNLIVAGQSCLIVLY